MNGAEERRSRRMNRLQNLAIALLTLSAVLLFLSLPLFGSLSDQSLTQLLRGRLLREAEAAEGSEPGTVTPVFPVRMAVSNGFVRRGGELLTTAGDEFDRAGAFLGEALGSAGEETAVTETAFLAALREEGLYLDFTADAMPTELLSALLGVEARPGGFERVRRLLLTPAASETAALYVQDGTGRVILRYSTAVSSAALSEFLASGGGREADFAFLLGPAYAELSPCTLIPAAPVSHAALEASNALSGSEDTILLRAGFNTHAENRFTESSGTSIVRELSSTLYLRPDGSVDYQGGEAEPGSLFFVRAALPDETTAAEAASAAQNLVSTLLQGLTGDASLYLSGLRGEAGRWEFSFDLMADGVPIRRSDGSHTATVTVEGRSVIAFSLKVRRYALSGETVMLLPPAQAAAVARVWDGAELMAAYVDTGAESVLPSWIAE